MPEVAERRGAQPCRCLWRVLVQMTRTTPLRLMTLHLGQMGLTDARTFMTLYLSS